MDHPHNRLAVKGLSLFSSLFLALSLIFLIIIAAQKTALPIYAAPIEPPAGYPSSPNLFKTSRRPWRIPEAQRCITRSKSVIPARIPPRGLS